MKFNERKTLLFLMGILCGIILMGSVVKKPQGGSFTILPYSKYQDLNRQKNQLESQVENLYREQQSLSDKLNDYKVNGGGYKEVMDNLSKELDMTRLMYGSTEVSGPGIKIIIDDRHDYSEASEIMDGITHDADILMTVYDLFGAGADAIAVNGNRIVSTSSIKCEGPVIQIDSEYVVAPFEITAIGDPDALESYYIKNGQYTLLASIRQLDVKILKLKDVTVPKYRGRRNNNYIVNIDKNK